VPFSNNDGAKKTSFYVLCWGPILVHGASAVPISGSDKGKEEPWGCRKGGEAAADAGIM